MARFVREGDKSIRPGLYLVLDGEAKVFNYLRPAEEDGPGSSEYALLTDSAGTFLKTSDGYYLAVKT